jgi:hypothetical protein
MAGPTESFQFDTFLTATIKNYDKELRKNFLEFRPATNLLMDNYGKKDTGGGRIWQGVAEYGSNPSIKWFDGADTFSQEVSQTALPIQYYWKYLGASVGWTRVEKAENRGQAQIFDIAESRLRQATRSMATKLNGDIFLDGTGDGGKTIVGLASLVSTTPATGTVGGLDAATNPYWRNTAVTSAGSFAANGVRGTAQDLIQTAFNNATDGMYDTPNCVLSSQDVFEYYNRTLLGVTRYLDSQSKVGDASFRSLEYNGIKWVWDRQCPSGRAFILNTNYLHFVTDPSMLFEWSEPLSYPNQLAYTRLCASRLFLRCTARMFHAVTDGWTA